MLILFSPSDSVPETTIEQGGGIMVRLLFAVVSTGLILTHSSPSNASDSVCEIIAKHGVYDFINEDFAQQNHSKVRSRVCSHQEVIDSQGFDLAGIYSGSYLSVGSNSDSLKLNEFCSDDEKTFRQSISKFTNNKLLNPKALDLLKSCVRPKETDRPRVWFSVKRTGGKYNIHMLYPKYPGTNDSFDIRVTLDGSTCPTGEKRLSTNLPDPKFKIEDPEKPLVRIEPAQSVKLNCLFDDEIYVTELETEAFRLSEKGKAQTPSPSFDETSRLYRLDEPKMNEVFNNIKSTKQLFTDYCKDDHASDVGEAADHQTSPSLLYPSKHGFRTTDDNTFGRFRSGIITPGASYVAFAVKTEHVAQAWFVIRPDDQNPGADPKCTYAGKG